MKRSCPYCGKVHDYGKVCSRKPKRAPDKAAQARFRSTLAWTKKSREIRQRDLNLCRLCLAEGQLNWTDLSVHHIIPLVEDESKALDGGNLVTLCRRHHEEAEAGQVSREALLTLVRNTPRGLERGKNGVFTRRTSGPDR